MIQSALLQSHRSFSLILICAMLGACATTQKSSTGLEDQAAAPISEAAPAQDAGKPGETPSSSSSGATGASSPSNPAKTAGAAGASSASSASSANTGTKQGSSEGTAAGSDNDDAAQLKRQLAEQDAQINRLREDQQAVAEREEAEAAKMQQRQSAVAADADEQQPAASGAASAARSNAQDDEAAVFPANGNAGEPGGGERGKLAVPRAVERSVYFGYNQASVADEYDAMLLANAAYLKAHPALITEVQGNCDERGSREYNLALGARRAESVKRALELAGADGSRINAISYGSEKPVAPGKDEESYSRNRRADIVY